MTKKTAHVAVFDDLADWEVGHLIVELRTGRYTGEKWSVKTFAASRQPVTTMGGVSITADLERSEVRPTQSDLLVLPGGDAWDSGSGDELARLAADFLSAGVPVAAICGATAGLARAGLLDNRNHTSSAAEYLQATGYAGGNHYVDERAVIDGDLITAGPQSPVQFAVATLRRLRLGSEEMLSAYEALMHDGDPSAFPRLMKASGAA